MRLLNDLELLRLAYLFLPLLGGAIIHGIFLRYNALVVLAYPIDFYRTYRKRRLFGDHKTIRGVVVFTIGTALVFVLQAEFLHKNPGCRELEFFDYAALDPWLFGLSLGAAAMLSELPNSFLKRQLDIHPGATAGGYLAPLFFFLDQVDLLLGLWLVLSLLMEVSFKRILVSLVLFFIMHQVITLIGYGLGMRKTLR